MRLFSDKLKALAQAEPPASWRFSAGFLFLPFVYLHDASTLMMLAMLNAVWCILAAGAFRRRCLATLLISYGLFVVLSFYLLRTARLPERVSYNIPLFINAICLYWAIGFHNLPAAITLSGRPGVVRAPPWRAKALRLAALVLVPVWVTLYLFSLSELTRSLWSANAFNRNLERISHKILTPIRTLMPGQQKPLLIPMPLDSVLEQCIFFYPSAEKLPFSSGALRLDHPLATFQPGPGTTSSPPIFPFACGPAGHFFPDGSAMARTAQDFLSRALRAGHPV